MGISSKATEVKDAITFKGTDKNGKSMFGLTMPDLKVGEQVSVDSVNQDKPSGFEYVKAWVLAKCETGENEIDCYKLSFGKNSKREHAVIPMTTIHAACLAR